jgi:hypothetical protein
MSVPLESQIALLPTEASDEAEFPFLRSLTVYDCETLLRQLYIQRTVGLSHIAVMGDYG